MLPSKSMRDAVVGTGDELSLWNSPWRLRREEDGGHESVVPRFAVALISVIMQQEAGVFGVDMSTRWYVASTGGVPGCGRKQQKMLMAGAKVDGMQTLAPAEPRRRLFLRARSEGLCRG